MKLLLDENLSRRLVPFLQNLFPGSSHVALLELEQATDRQVWDYARLNGFVIVTSDADFEELSFILGAPPRVVGLKGGNLSRSGMPALLTTNAEQIRNFIEKDNRACVEIIKPRI